MEKERVPRNGGRVGPALTCTNKNARPAGRRHAHRWAVRAAGGRKRAGDPRVQMPGGWTGSAGGRGGVEGLEGWQSSPRTAHGEGCAAPEEAPGVMPEPGDARGGAERLAPVRRASRRLQSALRRQQREEPQLGVRPTRSEEGGACVSVGARAQAAL